MDGRGRRLKSPSDVLATPQFFSLRSPVPIFRTSFFFFCPAEKDRGPRQSSPRLFLLPSLLIDARDRPRKGRRKRKRFAERGFFRRVRGGRGGDEKVNAPVLDLSSSKEARESITPKYQHSLSIPRVLSPPCIAHLRSLSSVDLTRWDFNLPLRIVRRPSLPFLP